MKFCPNFSDPSVKEQWDLITNDPELGKIEAMREFMEAQIANRPVGTPEQVKEKLKARFTPISEAEQEAKDAKLSQEILNKSNDPIFDDPSTLMGQAILSNPINGKNLSVENVSVTRAMEIVSNLSSQLGIDYNVISPEDAIRITQNSKNPWNTSKGPAFFYGNTVYFVGEALTSELAFHEFAHPIIRAIINQNPELFQKLYQDALENEPSLLNEAFLEYEDLRKSIEEVTDEDKRAELEEQYITQVAEEVLVKVLTKAAQLKENNLVPSKGFAKILNNVLYAIKQFLRKAFGQKIKISKLDASTTMDELANMLVEGKNFEISTDNVNKEDVVAYYQNNYMYLQDLKNAVERGDGKFISSLASRLYQGASEQIRNLIKNRNYSDLLELFIDEYNRGDLQEIRANVAAYAKDLLKKGEDLANDVDRVQNEITAVVNSMLRLEVMMTKMEQHLNELKKDTENKDNVHKVHYYGHVLEYWQKYIAEAQSELRKESVPVNSPIFNLLNNISETMKRSAQSINDVNRDGVGDVIWDQWKDVASEAEDMLNNKIERLEKKGASAMAINNEYVEFYGMPKAEYMKFKSLQTRVAKGESLSGEEKNYYDKALKQSLEGRQMTKYKIEAALRGEGKDANYANSYLEGYMYSTDPVIGGFAKFFKDNMTDMQARAQSRLMDIVNELNPYLDAAGIDFTNPGEYGKQLGFTDKMGYIDKDGVFQEKEVWTFLNEWQNHRLFFDKLDYEINELNKKFLHSNSTEVSAALNAKIAEKRELEKKWMHQEYVDDFYDKDDLINKDSKDPVAIEAYRLRQEIFNDMRKLNDPSQKGLDTQEVTKQMNELWKRYKLLYSNYYLDGTKKTNSFIKDGVEIVTNDLAIAERLQEHRAHTSKFYENVERKGVFQNALITFEKELYNKLVQQSYDPINNKEEFDDVFDAYRKEWINQNTRIVIKQEFYQKRTEILDKIKELTSKLPQAGLDFTNEWKMILDVVSGFRDEDGQPIGTTVPLGRRQKIKEAQESIQKSKEKWAGFSGLTIDQMETLIDLSKTRKTRPLTPDEWNTYTSLLDVQTKQGLSKADRATVINLFADLQELQSKEPTEYYVDALNYWLNKINDKEVYDVLGFNEFKNANIDKLYDQEVLDVLFSKSSAFEKWFKENHIAKQSFDPSIGEKGAKVTKQERLYIWNKIKPNDPSYYEKTLITKEDGTQEEIEGLPALKYYAKVVKKEFKTGYTKTVNADGTITESVKPIVGVQRDNRGNYLPKDVPNNPFRNERFHELKKAFETNPDSKDGKMFKLLEKLKEIHLKNQEGLGKRPKLYYDYPRFAKSTLEGVQSKSIGAEYKKKFGPVAWILKQLRDFFVGAKTESGNTFNWKQENMLVRADAFGDQIENIPIEGIYNLDTTETSTDIIESMLRYMQGAEHHKQLLKMNPTATALKNILTDPDKYLKEQDKIIRSKFVNDGEITYLNKKGRYIRKEAFDNFYDREFKGQTTTGWGKDSDWVQNLQKIIFKGASFSFFAFNIPSDLKNAMGAKFQSLIHSAGGTDMTLASLAQGEGWAFKYMSKLSFGDAYSKGKFSLEHQIGEVFDPMQNVKDKFGKSISRTLLKDLASGSFLYSFRKWSEIQAGMQAFGGMMYKKLIPMGDKMIPYMDAWELNKNGKIQLKAGIDPKYGITYDEAGNPIVGQEFKNFKNRIHIVMNKLNGAYSKEDQPEFQRYIAFRFVSFLRRYFTTMAMNRFGKKRWNIGYGEIDEGYYISAVKAFGKVLKSRNINDFTKEDAKAWMKLVTEVGTLYLIGILLNLMFDWDDDDEDRYAKLREKSGALPMLGVADIPGEEFNFGGFMSLHAMSLMMQIRAENEQFIPLPFYGLDNLTGLANLKSLAFGPTTDLYQQLIHDGLNAATDNPDQFFKRRAGAFEWEQQGSNKFWKHLAKGFGVRGNFVAPAYAIENFQKIQDAGSSRAK